MSRKRRLHLPRAGFHITARTQDGRQQLVHEMRSEISSDVEIAAHTFGHTLLAHAVMPNHIHIVLRQGETPLGWMMQRIMQRVVAKVRRRFGGSGHVFGSPYWSGVLHDSRYLRQAIAYTHLNPHKAALCDRPEDYEWTSHRQYIAAAASEHFDARNGLMLFADESLDLDAMIANYDRCIEYCIERRRSGVPGDWLLLDQKASIRRPLVAKAAREMRFPAVRKECGGGRD